MTIDIENFRGQTAEQITKTLLADGYQAVKTPDPLCRIFRDSQSSHLVRLSDTPRLSAAFCAACQADDDNGFLPKIFSHATFGPDLHVSVSENLVRLEEISQEPSITLFGHARAVSSFFAGDDMHKDVHRCMTYEPRLLSAAHALVAVAMKDGAPQTAINPCGDSIWFRNNKQGCQTVYADPFMAASGKSNTDCRNDLQWIETRLSEQERMASYSPYWRDTHANAP